MRGRPPVRARGAPPRVSGGPPARRLSREIRWPYNLFGTEQAKLHALDAAQRRRRRRKRLLHGGGGGSGGGPEAAASPAAGRAEVGSVSACAPRPPVAFQLRQRTPVTLYTVARWLRRPRVPSPAACMRTRPPRAWRVRPGTAPARRPLSARPSPACARSPARIRRHPRAAPRTVAGQATPVRRGAAGVRLRRRDAGVRLGPMGRGSAAATAARVRTAKVRTDAAPASAPHKTLKRKRPNRSAVHLERCNGQCYVHLDDDVMRKAKRQ